MSLITTESSLEEVFIASRGHLVRIARRILRNPELADEAVQDTYLRIAEMRMEPGVARPLAYWSRAVCNMALDYSLPAPTTCWAGPWVAAWRP